MAVRPGRAGGTPRSMGELADLVDAIRSASGWSPCTLLALYRSGRQVEALRAYESTGGASPTRSA